ncbi:MAG: ATPase domain-containing protein [Candidatus Aenigmatarchaeota archaeon]|nr:ATPase [Nanoarchaeota archaeon]
MERSRVSTGISGLDEKMQGGFFSGSSNLIVGKTGTGKTSFCASFLRHGALIEEPGVYVTTEQREDDIRGDILATFGWDMKQLETKKMIKFISIQPIFPSKAMTLDDINKIIKTYIYDILDKIKTSVNEIKAKRIVVDSISIMEMFIRDEYLSRVGMMQLIENLKKLGVTSVLTGTIPETSEALSSGGIVEYIVDTVIKLDFVPVAEEFKRTLTIRKMRRTDHSTMIHPFDIAKFGLKIIEIK